MSISSSVVTGLVVGTMAVSLSDGPIIQPRIEHVSVQVQEQQIPKKNVTEQVEILEVREDYLKETPKEMEGYQHEQWHHGLISIIVGALSLFVVWVGSIGVRLFKGLLTSKKPLKGDPLFVKHSYIHPGMVYYIASPELVPYTFQQNPFHFIRLKKRLVAFNHIGRFHEHCRLFFTHASSMSDFVEFTPSRPTAGFFNYRLHDAKTLSINELDHYQKLLDADQYVMRNDRVWKKVVGDERDLMAPIDVVDRDGVVVRAMLRVCKYEPILGRGLRQRKREFLYLAIQHDASPTDRYRFLCHVGHEISPKKIQFALLD